jgi:hypothetical protein
MPIEKNRLFEVTIDQSPSDDGSSVTSKSLKGRRTNTRNAPPAPHPAHMLTDRSQTETLLTFMVLHDVFPTA